MAAYADAPRWYGMMQAGMAQNLGWAGPARQYMALYEEACRARRDSPRQAPSL